MVGGLGDILWHNFFSIERQLAAVLSRRTYGSSSQAV